MTGTPAYYQRLALVAGSGIMLLKFGGWYLTHSSAILTDALESIVNVLASGFALYSIRQAARPQDQNHPYGHGKIEFVAVGLEGTFILLAALLALGKGAYSLVVAKEIQQLPLGAGITALTALANWGLARMLLVQGRRFSSKTMQADGQHLLTDVYTSLGLILGLALVYLTKLYWLDGLLAILFGLLILRTGYLLIRDSLAGILDETDMAQAEEIIQILNNRRQANWIDLHNLRLQRFGPRLHVDAHVTLPYYLSLQQAHDELDELGTILQKALPLEVEFFIHSDPCETPKNCEICLKKDCPVRQAEFKRRVNWQLKNVLPNEKHTVDSA